MTAVDSRAERKKADIADLLAQVQALPLKQRLRLMDALCADTTVENDDGVRFPVRSLSEYKRARRHASAASGPVLDWIRSFVPGDVFYDIGANTGSLALVTGRLHDGRVPVFAFEPAGDSFATLVRNIAFNQLDEVVTPLPVALFDRTGVERFYRASVGAGTALHTVGAALDYCRNPFEPASVETVMAFRLDDLVRICGLPQPTRIKIDVDGVEDKVLAGATAILAAAACELFVEIVEATPEDPHPAAVMALLEGHGYRCEQTVAHHDAGTYPRIFDALFRIR